MEHMFPRQTGTCLTTITDNTRVHERLVQSFRAGPITFSFEPEEEDFDALLDPDVGVPEMPGALFLQLISASDETYEFIVHPRDVQHVLLPVLRFIVAQEMVRRDMHTKDPDIQETLDAGLRYDFHLHTTREAFKTASEHGGGRILDLLRDALTRVLDEMDDNEEDE